ncbi:site-specific DNA-methyltransferase [uncultured Mailhella sp.]|uniref:DNA-methyltransferase n=1 Tax=uncultured Mailhella sp. TaxID=1981031 RepID=UPI002624C828|nr:site-specific DNA-methyltransferase [uncultured Mailhella sp.]
MELWQGDCLELMKNIPDGSVDMVLCDLPFGVTRNSWDVAIPFNDLWNQYKRICKPNAAIVLNCQEPFTSELIVSNKKDFKYKWTWAKGQVSGFLNAKKQPLRNCEDIAVFYSKQCTYNPQMRKGKPKKKATGLKTSNYGKFTDRPHISDTYYPTTLLEFSLPRFKEGHPTQKPISLLEYLIKTYTNPGETVLDNCMGSGSTGVACVNTGRDFIGIELDETYFEIAKKRIEEAGR